MYGYSVEPWLKHEGIKGQRWGVRRFQNEDRTWTEAGKIRYGDDTSNRKSVRKVNKESRKGLRSEELRQAHTIPKGTKIFRTTVNPNESNDGVTYVSYLDSDRNHYKGGWIRQTSGGKQAYENEYELKEDLKVPSRDELYSVISQIVTKQKSNIQKTCEAWLDVTMPSGSEGRWNIAGDDLTGEIDKKKWQKYVNDTVNNFGQKTMTEAAYFTAQSFGLNDTVRADAINELKKRGYNAMTDEASVGGQSGWAREGSDPLIVFDSSVLNKKKTTQIKDRDEKKANKKYEDWRKKSRNAAGAWSALDIYSDELYHHGIKGQRWGVKRFQNADRTWTEAGKIRYGRKGNGRDGAGYFGEKSGKVASGENTYFSMQNNKVKDLDHQKNSKSPAAIYAANIVLDILTLNPVYAAMDTYRGFKAIEGSIKSKKYDKERTNSEIDSKTGFHLKSKELSEKDDIKRVNPDVNDFNSNSKSNCALCTMTMEMRRRGYDVTANKAGMGYFDEEINRFFPGYKVKTYGRNDIGKGGGNVKASFGMNNRFASDIIAKIEKDQPEGSRGNICVKWANGGGHSMFYEIKNGKLLISDGQIAKIYDNPQKILKNCTAIQLGRLDNLDFDIKGIKEACR